MRCQTTRSSFLSRRPSTSLLRMSAGSAVRMNVRTSSRNADSSGVKRRSMVVPPVVRDSGALGVDDMNLMNLKEPGGAHAAADAHGDNRALGLAPAPFDQNVAHHARAAHAVGVADRDGAAVDVELVLRNAEAVAAVEHLARERFVEFPQIDVVHGEPLLREQL